MDGFSPSASAARPTRQRVLVIGLGFLGTHIAGALEAAGSPPRVLTRSAPAHGRDVARAGELVLGDAADPVALERALDGMDHVVYCAGGLLPAPSERAPELDARLTLLPLQAVLEALARRPHIALTYLSSGGTVYGNPGRVPTDEDQPTLPIGSYGALRLECEHLIARARTGNGLRVRVLRCATVYGEHQQPDRGQGAVVTFLRRVEREEPIVVYGDGSEERDYVYAGDVAWAVMSLLEQQGGPAVLNVGSGAGTSLAGLIRLVEAQIGRPALIERRAARPFDVRRIVLDVHRLQALTGFAPTPLEEGVARAHAWLARSPAAAGVGS